MTSLMFLPGFSFILNHEFIIWSFIPLKVCSSYWLYSTIFSCLVVSILEIEVATFSFSSLGFGIIKIAVCPHFFHTCTLFFIRTFLWINKISFGDTNKCITGLDVLIAALLSLCCAPTCGLKLEYIFLWRVIINPCKVHINYS